MNNFVKLFVILAVSACNNVWERRATLVASNAVILCDLSQTLWMADNGKWDHGIVEANPILGQTPSTGTIVAASLGSIAVNTAMYFILPNKWGHYVNLGVLGVEGLNVATQPNHIEDNGMLTAYSNQHHGCDIERKLR